MPSGFLAAYASMPASTPRQMVCLTVSGFSSRGNFGDAKKASGPRFRGFFAEMLARGIYLAPSAFEAGFVSLAHGERELAATLRAAEAAFAAAVEAD